jgi:hypothetical protein
MNSNDVYVNSYNESINSHFSTIEYTKLVDNDFKIIEERTKNSNNKVKLCIVISVFMIIITYIIAIIVIKY